MHSLTAFYPIDSSRPYVVCYRGELLEIGYLLEVFWVFFFTSFAKLCNDENWCVYLSACLFVCQFGASSFSLYKSCRQKFVYCNVIQLKSIFESHLFNQLGNKHQKVEINVIISILIRLINVIFIPFEIDVYFHHFYSERFKNKPKVGSCGYTYTSQNNSIPISNL